MTIVASIRSSRGFIIGSDSRVTEGMHIIAKPTPKIIEFPAGYVGWCGYTIVRHIIEDMHKSKKAYMGMRNSKDIREFSLHVFEKLAAYPLKGEVGGDLLFITKKGIFETDSFGDVIEHDKWAAIGSGRDYTLGTFHALEEIKMKEQEKLEKALQSACRHDAGCAPPFFYGFILK